MLPLFRIIYEHENLFLLFSVQNFSIPVKNIQWVVIANMISFLEHKIQVIFYPLHSLGLLTLSLYLIAIISPFVRQAKDLKAFSKLPSVKDYSE